MNIVGGEELLLLWNMRPVGRGLRVGMNGGKSRCEGKGERPMCQCIIMKEDRLR